MPWEYKRAFVVRDEIIGEFDEYGRDRHREFVDVEKLNAEGAEDWCWLEEVDDNGCSLFKREKPFSSRGPCMSEACQDTHVKYHALEVLMGKSRDWMEKIADLLDFPESARATMLPGLSSTIHRKLKKRLEAINDE